MISIRLSAGILKLLKLLNPGYKILPVSNVEKLKTAVETALEIDINLSENGNFQYNNKPYCLTWYLNCDSDNNRRIELFSIALSKFL